MGPDFKPPEVETPEQFRYGAATEDTQIDLKWWELFDDPVLYTLVNMALENNKDVKIAISRMEEARATLGVTRADQFPQLDIKANGTYGNFTGTSYSETTNYSVYIAPVLSWEIDFWGKYRRATESAQAQLLASEYGLRAFQLSLIAQTISTYYLMLDFHQRLDIARETLQSRLKSLDIIQQRFDKGILPEIDLNQAQIQKEIAAQAIPLYQRTISKTEHALSILIGRLPGQIARGKSLKDQIEPPEIPTGVPARVLERRPDIAQSLYQLNAQNARIGVATAMRLPAISLTGLFGYASSEIANISTDGGVWSLGGSILGPIFDFGKSKQRVVVEEARTNQALFAYEKAVLQAFREIEDALVEISTYRDEIASAANRLAAARNANELSIERYDKGVTSYLEVLEADRTLFSVQLELSQLKKEYLSAYVNLYKALGGGWLSKEEMQQAQTAQSGASATSATE